MPESRKKVVVEEKLDVTRIVLLVACVAAVVGVISFYMSSQPERAADVFTSIQQSQIASGALEFLILNQLSSVSVFQHGGINSSAYFDFNSQNMTNQNATNATLTGYACSGTICNFTIVIDNDNSSALSHFLNISDYTIRTIFYNASDGSLRNVSELNDIGQGNWSYNSSYLSFTLPGGDGWDYGVRDSAVGGSYWLNQNGSLYGRINITNDFISVGLTETEMNVYNSSGKVIFNSSFSNSVKADNVNLISLYGNGTQNKTVYFFDWSGQTWKTWSKGDLSLFSDDFSSYSDNTSADAAWYPTDSTKVRVNIANDNMDFNIRVHTNAERIYHDMGNGSVSNSSWILRFKYRLSTISNGDMWVMLADDTNSYYSPSATNDFISIFLEVSSNRFRTIARNDGTDSGGTNRAVSFATGTNYYVEIRRNSPTSATTTIYSDPSYTVPLGSDNITINSGVTSLKYIKVLGSNGADLPGNYLIGTIDDVKFWNDVTSVPVAGMPDWTDPRNKQAFKWRYGLKSEGRPSINMTFHMAAHDPFVRIFFDSNSTPYFHDNYTTSSGWTSQGSGDITITGGAAFANQVGNPDSPAATDRIYKSLGMNLSDTRWYLDFDFNYSSCTSGSYFAIPLTLTAGSSEAWYYGAEPNQDAVGALFLCNPGSPEGMLLRVKDGSTLTSGNQMNVISDNTRYYQRLERTGNTFRLSVFSDPQRTSLLSSDAVTVSGIYGLDTIQHGHYKNAIQTNAHGSTWYVDNVTIMQDSNITFPVSLPENRTGVTTADAGLVAHWNFNEGRGNNVTDVSGNGNTLSFGGGSAATTPYWVLNSSCRFGGCLEFDGGDVLMRQNPSFLSDQQGSISMWFKYAGTGDTEGLLDANDAATSSTDRWLIFQSTGSILHPALVYDNGVAILNAQITSAITDTNWHHLVTTSDGSTIRAYLDGTERSLTIAQGSNTGQWFGDLTLSRIGLGITYLDMTSGFDGLMDDVRIYSRPLSSAEVYQLYLTGLNQQKPGVYFTKNNATDNEEVLFAATNWRNLNHTGFNVFSNNTNYFSLNYTFNSSMNNNFMFALGTMGRMNTTLFSPANNATAFSGETMESVANSTLTWYDFYPGPTYEDDFSGYQTQAQADAAWVPTASYMNVNIAGDYIDFIAQNGDDRKIYYDLGNVSDTNWVLRFKMRFSAINAGSVNIFFVAMSSTTGASNTAQNFIQIGPYSSDAQPYNLLAGAGVRQDQSSYEARYSNTYTINKDYYVELRRVNATVAEEAWYSDDSYTVLALPRITLSNSGLANIVNLRYLKVNTYMANSGSHTGTIDDVQFWNNVSNPVGRATRVFSSGTGLTRHTANPAFNYDGGAAAIWRFDEGIGANATDSSGNSKTAAMINGPTWESGASCKYGSCVRFDGSNDYLTSGANADWKFLHDGTTPTTVEFWVRSDGAQAAQEPMIIDTQGGTASNTGLSIYWGGGGTNQNLYYFLSDGTGSDTVTSTALAVPANVWTHVAFVWDQSTVRVYRDGQFYSSTAASSFTPSSGNPAYTLNIGRNPRTGFYFDGSLDELRIYKRALRDFEIYDHYLRDITKYHDDFGTSAGGKTYRYFGVEDANTTLQPVTPAGTVLHYRFNDNSTTNVTDVSGMKNNGGNIGGTTWIYNSSCRNGFGGCMLFDGSDDYIDAGNGQAFDFTRELTLSAWIKRRSTGSSQTIISKWEATTGGQAWNLLFDPDVVGFGVSKASGTTPITDYTYITTPSTYADTEWHHIVGTYRFVGDGSSVMRIYVDGVEQASSSSAVGPIFVNTRNVRIGKWIGSGRVFNGLIDDPMIINRSLSSDEVRQLYLGGVQRRGGDLVGWWKFNDLGKPDVEEDFNYASQAAADNAWQSTDNNLLRVNVSTGQLFFKLQSTNTLHSIAYDFGAGNVSDSNWILRYRMRLTNGAESASAYFYGLMSSLDETSGGTVAQDLMGGTYVTFSSGNPDGVSSAYVDGAAFFSSGSGHTGSNFAWNLDKDYYIELRRISSTNMMVSVYSDPEYSVLLGQSGGSIPSSIGGLRYYKLLNRHDVSQVGYTQGIIDDLRFWNNVSSFPRNTLDSSGVGNTAGIGYNGTAVSGRFGAALPLSGSGGYVSVSNSTAVESTLSSLKIGNELTLSSWVRFNSNVSNGTFDSDQGIIDSGDYRLYVDRKDARLKFELANGTIHSWYSLVTNSSTQIPIDMTVHNGTLYVASYDGAPGILAFNGTSWYASYHGYPVWSLASYKSKLYAGIGASVYVLENGVWTLSYNVPVGDRVKAMFVFNNTLYAGMGDTSGAGDIYMFDGASWSRFYDGSTTRIDSMAAYNGKLYVGTGGIAGSGDVIVFNGASASTSYDGSTQVVDSLAVYDGKLYAGLGEGSGNSDIYEFDGTTWRLSYDGSLNNVNQMVVYNGRLYAAIGTNGAGGGSGQSIYHDGFRWTTSNSFTGQGVYAMSVYNGTLYAANRRNAAGLEVHGFGSNAVLESPGAYGNWTGNAWNHVAATYDGSTMRLYRNGTLVSSRSVAVPVATNIQKLLIGNDFGAGYFNGTIDDVKIWRRALTADEVANEYRQNQDQHSLYGNVHRIVSADGLPSVIVNISDHDSLYQRDHDQRVLTFMSAGSAADTTAPTISVQSPTNSSYGESSVWANATINEAGSMWLRLDGGTNTSMSNSSGNWNAQLSVGSGPHNVVFYANDSSGNEATPVTVFFTYSPVVISMDINRTFSNGFPWWADNITISGWATYNGGYPFNSTNGTIVINQTMPNNAPNRLVCSTTGNAATGFYSCWYIANYEVGDTTLTVHAVRTNGAVAGSLSGTVRVRPTYGQEPAGSTPRHVLEIPGLIQEPSGRIRVVLDRVTVSKGAPN